MLKDLTIDSNNGNREEEDIFFPIGGRCLTALCSVEASHAQQSVDNGSLNIPATVMCKNR